MWRDRKGGIADGIIRTGQTMPVSYPTMLSISALAEINRALHLFRSPWELLFLITGGWMPPKLWKTLPCLISLWQDFQVPSSTFSFWVYFISQVPLACPSLSHLLYGDWLKQCVIPSTCRARLRCSWLVCVWPEGCNFSFLGNTCD